MRSRSAVPEHPESDRVPVGEVQMRLSDLCIGADVCVTGNGCPCVCGSRQRPAAAAAAREEMVSALRMRTGTAQPRTIA